MEDKKSKITRVKSTTVFPESEVGQQMANLQIECQGECSKSNNEKPNGADEKAIEHLHKILDEKQRALDDLKDQYNKVVIELENLRRQIAGASNNVHPGSDLCVSPMVADARLQSEIQNKKYKIAELESFVRGYYKLVLEKMEENNCLSQQLSASKAEITKEKERTLNEVQDFKSLNKKLSLQADDLKGEKERLYDKLSRAESELDTLKKAKEDGKKNFAQQNSVPETETEKYKAMVAELRLQTENLKREIESHKQHSRDQEDKIEKLHVRCGRAEEDLQRMSMVKGQSDQPDANNWPVLSLDSRDAIIQQLHVDVRQRDSELERLRREVQQLQNRPTADPDEEIFVKEQLKAFQDDYHQERQEKVSLLQERNELEKKNEYLLQQLQQRQQQPSHLSGPAHPHERHYAPSATPRHPGGREESGHYNSYNTPHTRLPGPPVYENTIPPRDAVQYGSHLHEQHPVQSQPYHSSMPASHQDMQGGGYQNRHPNRGNSRESFSP